MKHCIKLLLLGMVVLFTNCDKDKDEIKIITMTVDSQTTLCNPSPFPSSEDVECMIVKENNNTDYLPIGSIRGFEYEKGFEYVLKVKRVILKDPPMDGSSYEHYLIEILSKNKKE